MHCLNLRGFETYWPQVRGKLKPQSLFPGYCFVLITLQWSPARWAPGVTKLLMNGDEPAKVPDRIIAELRSRERDGLIVLPPPPRFRPGACFRPGDQVRIKDGVLTGCFGLVDGMRSHKRISVLLEMLGGARPIEMPAADVALIGE